MVGVHGHEFIPTGMRIHPDEILRVFGLYRNQRRSVAARNAFRNGVSGSAEAIGSMPSEWRPIRGSRVSRDLFSRRVKIVGHIAANGVVADCFFFSLSPSLLLLLYPLFLFFFFCRCTSTAVSLARDKAVETKATSSLPAKVKG